MEAKQRSAGRNIAKLLPRFVTEQKVFAEYEPVSKMKAAEKWVPNKTKRKSGVRDKATAFVHLRKLNSRNKQDVKLYGGN